MIYKVFRFDDIHAIGVIGFANPLPRKDLAVFLSPSRAPEGGGKQTAVFWIKYCSLWNHTTLRVDDIQWFCIDDIHGVVVIGFAAPPERPRGLSFRCPVAIPRGG